MSGETSSLILVAALTSVLRDSLQAQELAGVVDDQLRDELDRLLARIEAEIAAIVQRDKLHLAPELEEPGEAG